MMQTIGLSGVDYNIQAAPLSCLGIVSMNITAHMLHGTLT